MLKKNNYKHQALWVLTIFIFLLVGSSANAQEQILSLGESLEPITKISLYLDEETYMNIINDSSEGETLSVGENKESTFDATGLEAKSLLNIEGFNEELIHAMATNSCIKVEPSKSKVTTSMRGNFCKTNYSFEENDDAILSAGLGMTYKINSRSKIVTSIYESLRYSDVEDFSFGDRERTVLIQLKISLGQ